MLVQVDRAVILKESEKMFGIKPKVKAK